MRDLPFSGTGGALGLAVLVTIQAGTQTIRFTTGAGQVIRDGNLYTAAPGATITNIEFPGDCTPATCDINLNTSHGIIAAGEAESGVYDGWPITVEFFDLGNPAAGAFVLIPGATIGSVGEDTNGALTIAVNGPLAQLQGSMLEHYSLTGRESLGDDRCKIPIVVPDIARNTAYVTIDVAGGLQKVSDCYGRVRLGGAGTVEDYQNLFLECTTAGTTGALPPDYTGLADLDTIADGTAIFTAHNSWLRHARGQAIDNFNIQLEALPDDRASDATWFVPGGLYFRSGPRQGYPEQPIVAWDPDTLTLRLGLPVAVGDVPPGTQLELRPGCDLTSTMCNARFDNIINAREEDLVPPPDLAFLGS